MHCHRQDYQLQDSDDQVQGQNQVLLPKEQLLGVAEECNQSSLLDQIKLAQATNDEIWELKKKSGFLSKNECVMHFGQIVVPKNICTEILETGHTSPIAGHTGIWKTYKSFSREFWWHTMQKNIIAYIELCHVCVWSESTYMKPASLLHPLPVLSRL